jgi:hypothetical protein
MVASILIEAVDLALGSFKQVFSEFASSCQANNRPSLSYQIQLRDSAGLHQIFNITGFAF